MPAVSAADALATAHRLVAHAKNTARFPLDPRLVQALALLDAYAPDHAAGRYDLRRVTPAHHQAYTAWNEAELGEPEDLASAVLLACNQFGAEVPARVVGRRAPGAAPAAMTPTDRLAAARAAYLAEATAILRDLFTELCALAPKLQTLRVTAGPEKYSDAEGDKHDRWDYDVTGTKTDGYTFTTGHRDRKGEVYLRICAVAAALAIPLDIEFNRDDLPK